MGVVALRSASLWYRSWIRFVVAMLVLPAATGNDSIDKLAGYVEDLYRESSQFITVLHGILTPPQCRHLIALAATSYIEGSRISGNRWGGHRQSNSSFLITGYWKDSVVQDIANKIEFHSQVPQRQWEPLEATHYSTGGFYNRHKDGSMRTLTAILYLNDLPEGGEGETVFTVPNDEGMKSFISVTPRRGKAIIFSSNITHQSNRVAKGDKWIATWYMSERSQSFGEYFVIPLLIRGLPLGRQAFELHYTLLKYFSVHSVMYLYQALGLVALLGPICCLYQRGKSYSNRSDKSDVLRGIELKSV
eukprot:TRINITY_DN30011_c0_g1_i1.p1 TRINITY_DN30011_c0_g1~~TRINITY_DN30011_c0_g1_i1.p1  ORF type:complete len:304 (+),score=33.55 TRINITY_DN30011_c0_g1_i1:95-1006(+)